MYHFNETSQKFSCIDPNPPSRGALLYILGCQSNEISNYPVCILHIYLLSLLHPVDAFSPSLSSPACFSLMSLFPDCLGSQSPLNLLPPLCFFLIPH